MHKGQCTGWTDPLPGIIAVKCFFVLWCSVCMYCSTEACWQKINLPVGIKMYLPPSVGQKCHHGYHHDYSMVITIIIVLNSRCLNASCIL